jgi:hypothetical protein
VPASFYGGAPKGPHAMYTDSGFAKLRAQATASGIGSLSAMDQNQLRTYGGWQDAAVSRAITSGAARGGGGYNGGGSRSGAAFRFEFGRGTGQVEQALISWLKDTVRKSGGDVQKVLGR